MKIIIAPAKRMRNDVAYLDPKTSPIFHKEAMKLLAYLKTLSYEEVKKMLGCNEQIAKQAYYQYHHFTDTGKGTCALLAYDGIQYQYMAPSIFPDEYYAYVEQHLWILSGLYGILRPFDEVNPYRLELNHICKPYGMQSLYAYWGAKPFQQLIKEDNEILDLASVQYGNIMKHYVDDNITYKRCRFFEEEEGIVREKGVYVKMARGEMVRWLAETNAQSFDDVKAFTRLGYQYQEARSDKEEMVFIRKKGKR